MSSSSTYPHTTTAITDAWLVKGLRLFHSKKPSDLERLKKLYREACDNETQVLRITLTDALRDYKDAAPTETAEVCCYCCCCSSCPPQS